MSLSLPVSLGGPTRAAKPERHIVASLFAKATTKLGLATAIAVEAQSRRSSDVVDPLCEVSIDVWQTLRPLLKQQARAAQ
jgi:hypothetical protein